jgi:hypothetical protein
LVGSWWSLIQWNKKPVSLWHCPCLCPNSSHYLWRWKLLFFNSVYCLLLKFILFLPLVADGSGRLSWTWCPKLWTTELNAGWVYWPSLHE